MDIIVNGSKRSVPEDYTAAQLVQALDLGQRLYQFPMGVFGVALGTVLFPLFARHAEQRRRLAGYADHAVVECHQDLRAGPSVSRIQF